MEGSGLLVWGGLSSLDKAWGKGHWDSQIKVISLCNLLPRLKWDCISAGEVHDFNQAGRSFSE